MAGKRLHSRDRKHRLVGLKISCLERKSAVVLRQPKLGAAEHEAFPISLLFGAYWKLRQL
jgi:hypothetical protein